MNRLLKIIATVIALIVLIVIIAIVVMILFINPNRFKPLIIKQVYAETGRTLSIPGDISWSFFPSISITTASVTLSNPPGYTQPVFVHADSAKAEVRLFPLLTGNVEPKTIILSGAKLYLIKNKQQQENWSQWGTNPSADVNTTTKANTASAKPTNTSFNIIIPNINISNADIQYIDETTQTSFTLSNLNLQAKRVHFNTPFPVVFNTDFSSKNPDTRGHINFNATVIYDKKSLTANNINLTGQVALPQTNNQLIPLILSGNANISDNRLNLQPVNLQIATLNADGYLNVTSISQTEYAGAINIKAFNACDFLTSFNIKTSCANAGVLKQVGFNTVFSSNKNSFNLNSFNAKIDNGTIEGKLDLDNLRTKTGKFSLYLSHINVDQYLDLINTNKPNTKTVKTDSNAANKIQLPEIVKAYDVAGNISAKDFTVNKLHLDSLETQLVSNYGFINLYPLDVTLYKGKLSGAVSANFKELEPVFTARLLLNKVDLYPLLSDLLNFKNASGILTLNTNITARGSDTQSLKQHLNGQATVHVIDGALQNMDIPYYYQTGLALLRGEKPSATKSNVTHIGSLSASCNIENGIAHNDDLNLISHDFTMTGTGTINLPDNTLNYLLHIKDKQGNIIPLIISGSLMSPSVKVDLSEAIKQNAEKQIKGQLQNKLKNALGGLGL